MIGNSLKILWVFVMLSVFHLNVLAQIEVCNNGIDDDGDGWIDDYDPDCCDFNLNHFFENCSPSCFYQAPDQTLELKLEKSYRNNWARRNTPLVGKLKGDTTFIIGMSNNAPTSILNANFQLINGFTDESIEIKTTHFSNQGISYALGNLDGVGDAEIVVATDESRDPRRLIAYHLDGTIMWKSDYRFGYQNLDYYMTPHLADFNLDGLPEVYIGNQIFNGANGNLIAAGGDNNNLGLQIDPDGQYRYYMPIAADVLPDNFGAFCDGLELIVGNQVFAVDVDLDTMYLAVEISSSGDGFSSVADMDGDGVLDVVTARRIGSQVEVTVWKPSAQDIISQFMYNNAAGEFNSGSESPILLTDVNQDGSPDIVFGAIHSLIAFENRGNGNFDLLWEKNIKNRAGRPTPTAFDFFVDGELQIIHRDEDSLYIIDGISGNTRAAVPCQSLTYFDKPIVANVDKDPSAEILCTCGGNLSVFESAQGVFPAARPIWNQQLFQNTQVNDDLSFPNYAQNPALVSLAGENVLNNFLQPYQSRIAGADLQVDSFSSYCERGVRWLNVFVSNQTEENVFQDISLEIFAQDPTLTAANIVLDTTIYGIGGLSSKQLVLDISNFPTDLYVVLNRNLDSLPIDTSLGSDDFDIFECNYANNLIYISNVLRRPNLEVTSDTALCPGSSIEISAASDSNNSYYWNTGDTTTNIVISNPGLYTVEVVDQCGSAKVDSVHVDSIAFAADIPDTVCQEGAFLIDANIDHADQTYILFNQDTLCNCASINFIPQTSGQFQLIAKVGDCQIQKNFELVVLKQPIQRDTFFVCPGGSQMVNGVSYNPGSYSDTFSTLGYCDSIYSFAVLEYQKPDYSVISDTICMGSRAGAIQVTPNEDRLEQILWLDNNSRNYSRAQLSPGWYPFSVQYNNCWFRDTARVIRNPFEFEVKVLQAGCERDRGEIEFYNLENCVLTYNDASYDSLYLPNLQVGRYYFNLSNQYCQLDTMIQIVNTINQYNFPPANLSVDLGDSLILGADIPGVMLNPHWSPNDFLACTNCVPTTIKPKRDITYTLKGEDAGGCVMEKEYIVKVNREGAFFIPNVFSPNNDEVNDHFEFYSKIPVSQIQYVRIYDRFGNLIHERRNIQEKPALLWDGKAKGQVMNDGVYVFELLIEDTEGYQFLEHGSITLVK